MRPERHRHLAPFGQNRGMMAFQFRATARDRNRHARLSGRRCLTLDRLRVTCRLFGIQWRARIRFRARSSNIDASSYYGQFPEQWLGHRRREIRVRLVLFAEGLRGRR